MTGRKPDARTLIAGFLAGDLAALRVLDSWILPVIRHRTWKLAGEEEDLLQEVRMKLLRLFEAGAFREESSLKTYARSTAKYTCLDAVRRARIRKAEVLEEELIPVSDDNPVETLDRRERARLAYRVLQALPDGCRRLFRLVLERELGYQAIAEELEVSLGTVKSRMSRCRDRAVALRDRFASGAEES